MYYLQSRYYDPMVGRFVNGDDVEYILSDESSFEYCYNSPVNYSDFSGYKPGSLFSSSDAAAKDFACCYYNISLYIRFEISSVIYALQKNGRVMYSYTNYIVGNPHSCSPLNGKRNIPKGAWLIGAIHTHPNSNSFSPTDKTFAKKHYISFYVVTPNFKIRVYHDTRRGFQDKLVAENLKLSPLTRQQANNLVENYKFKWKIHTRLGCDFKCRNKKWPSW